MPYWRLRARTFVLGFVEVLNGLATMICLGWSPGWDIDFIMWDSIRWYEKEARKEKESAIKGERG